MAEFLNELNDSHIVLGAAFIGAVPGIIALFFQLIIVQLQIWNERAESKRGRDFDIKRQTILAGIDAISKNNELIGALVNMKVNDFNLKRSENKYDAAFSKLCLVCGLDTIGVLADYHAIQVEASFALIAERSEIDQLLSEIEIEEKGIANIEVTQRELLDQINVAMSKTPHDENFIAHLYENRSKNFEDIAFRYGKISDHYAQITKMQLNFTETTFNFLGKLAEPCDKVLVALRQELELPTKDSEYKNIMASLREKTGNSLEKLMERIHQKAVSQPNCD